MSTAGFLAAPLAFDFVRSWPRPLQSMDWARAQALCAEMEQEGQALLESSGVAPVKIRHERSVDMRYVGQGHEIRVPLPSGILSDTTMSAIAASFERVYRQVYGRSGPPVPVEIINWRVVSSGPAPDVRLIPSIRAGGDARAALKGHRPAYFGEHGYVDTPVYDRYSLGSGAGFTGPAIVEERESTLIIGPGGHASVDEGRNLIVEIMDRGTGG